MLGSNKKKLEVGPIHSVSDDPQYVAVRDNLARLKARHQELLRMDREILQHPEPRMTAQEQISRAASQLTVEGQSAVAIEAPGCDTAATVRREREILEVAITRETQNLGRRQQLASQKILQAERHAIVDHSRQLAAVLANLVLMGIADHKLRRDLASRGVDIVAVPLKWLSASSTPRCWSPFLAQAIRGAEMTLDAIANDVPELLDDVQLLKAEIRDAKVGYEP